MTSKIVTVAFMMLGTSFLLLLSPSGAAEVTPDNCMETDQGIWCSETILSDTMKFDGVSIGDADNDGTADVVATGLSGNVMMASMKNGEWIKRTIWESPGEVIVSVIGDADNDGNNEVVVVGMVAGPEADTGAGMVTMIKGSGNQWTTTRIFTDGFMVHGVAIGDVDPDHPGNEVVAAGFSHNMTLISKTGSEWTSEFLFQANHKIRTVVISDVDGDGKNEVTAASKDANVYIVEKSGGNWVNKTVFTDPDAGEARCATGDLDGDGKMDIVAGGDSSHLAFIKGSGSTFSGNIIWTDSDKLRGAWIGDVYDGNPGNEILAAGYSGNVTLHTKVGSDWKHTVIFHDDNRLHHLVTGNANPDHPGMEIVTTGYSNKVTVIGQYHPDFTISMTGPVADVTFQSEVDLKVTLTSVDFYTDEIDMAIEDLPTGASASFSSDPVILSSEKAIVSVTISVPASVANGNHTFKVKATGQLGTKMVEGHIKVNREIAPTVTAPDGVVAKKGKLVSYTFNVKNGGNMADSYSIEVSSSTGIKATPSLTQTLVLDPDENVTVLVTMSIPKDQKGKEDILTFKARSNFDNTTTDSVTVSTTIKKDETTSSACGGVILFSIMLSTVGLIGTIRYRRRT